MAKKPDENQAERFKKAAREAECSEDEERFRRVLKKVAKSKPSPSETSDDG